MKKEALTYIYKYRDFVNPYVGSGMLSNTFDDQAIFTQSKRCALVAISDTIEELAELIVLGIDDSGKIAHNRDYLTCIKETIEALEYKGFDKEFPITN